MDKQVRLTPGHPRHPVTTAPPMATQSLGLPMYPTRERQIKVIEDELERRRIEATEVVPPSGQRVRMFVRTREGFRRSDAASATGGFAGAFASRPPDSRRAESR